MTREEASWSNLSTSGHRQPLQQCYLPSYMTAADIIEFRRLTLQVERDLLARSHLRLLAAAADSTLAGHRQALRTVSARIKRVERTRERVR